MSQFCGEQDDPKNHLDDLTIGSSHVPHVNSSMSSVKLECEVHDRAGYANYYRAPTSAGTLHSSEKVTTQEITTLNTRMIVILPTGNTGVFA